MLLISHAFVDDIEAFDVRKLGGFGGSVQSSSGGERARGSGVVLKWRCGRGTDFALSKQYIAAVSCHHQPGACLRLYHRDLSMQAPASSSSAGAAQGVNKASRLIPLTSVVVDQFQARIQATPRGIAVSDDACAVYLDSKRIILVHS